MAHKRRNIAIIGLGIFGMAIARELTRIGDRVLGIDSDEQHIRSLCDEIDGVVQADAADIKALSQCSLDNYDAVIVCIGEDIQASILASMNALELGCKQLWVKAQSAAHKKILQAIGVHNVVLPELTYGINLAQIIHNPRISDYLAVGINDYVAQITVPERLSGETINSLGLIDNYELICVGLYQGGLFLHENLDDILLNENDSLILFGKRPQLRRFADSF